MSKEKYKNKKTIKQIKEQKKRTGITGTLRLHEYLLYERYLTDLCWYYLICFH